VTSVSEHPRDEHPRGVRRPPVGIPRRLLIASGAFGGELTASQVADAIARGLRDGGRGELDLCPLEHEQADDGVRELLDALNFDARMRGARAVIVAAAQLERRALAGSVTFELATRARQGGVPAYAVTGANALNLFDARILDLQIILEAPGRRALVSAGCRLAELV